MHLLVVSYSLFLFLFCIVDALKAANAHIAAVEAKLNASREAWDIASAAKVAAERSAKSAENKAKKAEKALVDADQKRVRREQRIAKHLDRISALVGGKYHVVPSLSTCSCFCFADICSLFLIFVFRVSAEKVGVSLEPLQPDNEDPLTATVDLLESN
jgi:hypothetical protein